MTEDLAPRPEDPYGISKYAAELDLHAAHAIFGLPFIVFRPHNVYGEHQNIGDPYRNVVGIFMNCIMSGKPLPVFGDGNQRRAFTHIADVAPQIADSVNCPQAYNEVFNIGSDTPYTVNELARIVTDVFHVPLNLKHLPPREEVYHAYANHDKSASVLGIRSTIDLCEGIRRMSEWAMKTGARTAKPFENIEIARNLPPSWAVLAKSIQ